MTNLIWILVLIMILKAIPTRQVRILKKELKDERYSESYCSW